MFVVKEAMKKKFHEDHYVFIGVRSHKPGREISLATAQECQAREVAFPGTFHIVNGFIFSQIWRSHEAGLERLQDQFHCVHASFDSKTFNEPWSPSGLQDDQYNIGEESMYWSRNKDQNRPFLIGGNAGNRFFSFVQSIYAVNLCHDGSAGDQLTWRYESPTGPKAADNRKRAAERPKPDQTEERAMRFESRANRAFTMSSSTAASADRSSSSQPGKRKLHSSMNESPVGATRKSPRFK